MSKSVTDPSLPLLPLLLSRIGEHVRTLLEQEGMPIADYAAEPQGGRFVLFDSRVAAAPTLVAGQTAIDLSEVMDEDQRILLDRLTDLGSAPHAWQVGPLRVTEEVSAINRYRLRRHLVGAVRAAVESAGGIWLCTAAYPYPYRTALNLRIDYDEFDEHDFHSLLDALDGHEHASTHFVCAVHHEKQPRALARLQGLDVGSHGYWHHTYLDAASNHRNISRGIDVLRALGLQPHGFVAPHGRFNEGLSSALNSLGIAYSSEFAFAYDDVPLYPTKSSVLQVPVHPVCLGLCLEAARKSQPCGEANSIAVEAFSDHLRRLVQGRLQSGRPVFVYGHPTGRLGTHPEVVRRLFESVKGYSAVWHVTMGEFASWWSKRNAVRVRVLQERGFYTIEVSQAPRGYRLGLEYWRGDLVAAMPVDEATVRFAPEALAYQQRRDPEMSEEWRVDRPHSLRARLARQVDWERVTPDDEIDMGSWRGVVKRALRLVKPRVDLDETTGQEERSGV